MTIGARELNRRGAVGAARLGLGLGPLLAIAASAALLGSVWTLAPTSHVYPAILWAIAVWVVAHSIVAVIMQAYCLAGSIFGKLTPRYDADLWNSTLFWHFHALAALVACAVLGLAPRLL